MVTLEEIQDAQRGLPREIRRTPLVRADDLSARVGAAATWKSWCLSRAGR